MNPEDYNDALPRIKRYQQRQESDKRFAVAGVVLYAMFIALVIAATN